MPRNMPMPSAIAHPVSVSAAPLATPAISSAACAEVRRPSVYTLPRSRQACRRTSVGPSRWTLSPTDHRVPRVVPPDQRREAEHDRHHPRRHEQATHTTPTSRAAATPARATRRGAPGETLPATPAPASAPLPHRPRPQRHDERLHLRLQPRHIPPRRRLVHLPVPRQDLQHDAVCWLPVGPGSLATDPADITDREPLHLSIGVPAFLRHPRPPAARTAPSSCAAPTPPSPATP